MAVKDLGLIEYNISSTGFCLLLSSMEAVQEQW